MVSDDDKSIDQIAPSIEEQVKFMRKSRKSPRSTRLQKTTEFNVAKKLKREQETNTGSESVDQRLDLSLKREQDRDIFQESLLSAIADSRKTKSGTRKTRGPGRKTKLFSEPSGTDFEASGQEDKSRNTNTSKQNEVPREGTIFSSAEALSQTTAFPHLPAANYSAYKQERDLGVQNKQAPSSFFDLERQQLIKFARETRVELRTKTTSFSCELQVPEAESHSLQDLEQDELPEEKQVQDTEPAHEIQQDQNTQETNNWQDQKQELELANQTELDQKTQELSPGSELMLGLPSKPENELLNFEEEARTFRSLAGIELRSEKNKNIKLVLNAGGETLTLFEVEASFEGINEAYSFALDLINQYAAKLSSTFGIEFSSQDEPTVHQLLLGEGTSYVQGKLIRARAPRMDELKALHAALEFSWPAVFQGDGELALKVAFLEDFLAEDEETGVCLKYMEDGRPILFISPKLCSQGVPTDLDPVAGERSESWQASIMREMSWKSAFDCQRFPLSDKDYKYLGWLPIEGDEPVFGIKTKDGQIFLPLSFTDSDEKCWVRCNEKGELLNAAGDYVSDESEVIYLSDHEVASRAEVSPAGDNFFSVEDEIIEALRLYRQGPQWRAHLAKTSEPLYKTAKDLDQASINRCYAPGKNYQGMIRAASGALVDNTAAEQKQLAQFEMKYLRNQSRN